MAEEEKEEKLHFRADEKSLIQFGDAGSAPILNYNIPQPSEYNGRNYIELVVNSDIWTDKAKKRPEPRPDSTPTDSNTTNNSTHKSADSDLEDIRNKAKAVMENIKRGNIDGTGQPGLNPDPSPSFAVLERIANLSRLGGESPNTTNSPFTHILPATELLSDEGIETRLADLNLNTEETGVGFSDTAAVDSPRRSKHEKLLDELVAEEGLVSFIQKHQDGHPIVKRKKLNGATKLAFGAKATSKITPRITLIESVRMSSFLGDYGAGKTINTFSLLPGETHEISIKTYKKSKQKTIEASSILDSYEEDTATEFSDAISAESSSKDASEDKFDAHVEAEASVSWGVASGSVSGGVASSTSSAREEFAKNISNATQKQSAKAASKRQVEINTSTETETEESEEQAITRKIENINVGRTLNFVFRQMNQKFVTVLYVTDVRIGFHNGDSSTWREIPLPNLEAFLEEMVKEADRDSMRLAIHDALYYTFDWKGEHRPMLEERELKPGENVKPPIITDPQKPSPYTYWKYCHNMTPLNRNKDGVEASIPGVVIGVTDSTLPTDGVIVEALLGQGNALDAYSLGLQMEAVREKLVTNDHSQTNIDLAKEKLKAVENKDTVKADILAQLFPEKETDKKDTNDG